MECLYAVSIRGKMYYFSGYIPEEKYAIVEEFANQLEDITSEYCKNLSDTLLSNLGIQLKYCPIEYIFRVRRK